MSNPIHFAEAFNFFLYKGNPEIDPADLSTLDITEIAVPYGNSAHLPVQKYRVVLKQWKTMTDGKALYTVLGIENQSEVHYAIPSKTDSMISRTILCRWKKQANHTKQKSGTK